MKTKVTISFEFDPTDYLMGDDLNNEGIQELVHDMMNGHTDWPFEFDTKLSPEIKVDAA